MDSEAQVDSKYVLVVRPWASYNGPTKHTFTVIFSDIYALQEYVRANIGINADLEAIPVKESRKESRR
jgi:hypothetical protein